MYFLIKKLTLWVKKRYMDTWEELRIFRFVCAACISKKDLISVVLKCPVPGVHSSSAKGDSIVCFVNCKA